MASDGEKLCTKLDDCGKITMILDKDLSFDYIYAVMIRRVCAKCTEAEYVQRVSDSG